MQQEIRKGYEWFRLLPKKEQKEFKREFSKNSLKNMPLDRYLNQTFKSSEFIYRAFNINAAKKGGIYWIRASIKIDFKRSDKTLLDRYILINRLMWSKVDGKTVLVKRYLCKELFN